MRYRSVISIAMACLSSFCAVRAAQVSPPDATRLVKNADFVGFVRARPYAYYDPTDRTRAWDLLACLDAVKGSLPRGDGVGSMRTAVGDRSGVLARSARLQSGMDAVWSSDGYNDDGYYLVFLHRSEGDRPAWTLTASHRVEFRAGDDGRVRGFLVSYPGASQPLEISDACRMLRQIDRGGEAGRNAAARLNPFLASACLAAQHEPCTHAERLRYTRALADGLRLGTTRADVEKVLLQRVDGGDYGAGLDRYYVGNQVMVEVPFGPDGRINGPLRVFKSLGG